MSSCWEHAFSAILPSVPMPQEKRLHMETHLLANNNKKEATLVKKKKNPFFPFSGLWSRWLAWLVLPMCRVRVLLERIWELASELRLQSRFLPAVWPWPVTLPVLPSSLSYSSLSYWGPPEPRSLTDHIIVAFTPPAIYLLLLSVFSHRSVSSMGARFFLLLFIL